MLIAVEGVGAAGKSTLIRALADHFGPGCLNLADELKQQRALDATLGEFIHRQAPAIDGLEEIFLFAARLASKARIAQEWNHHLVLADRYHSSFVVLAHHIRGLPADLVEQITCWAVRGHWPVGIVALDTTYEAYVRRRSVNDRSHVAREGRQFFERSRAAFSAHLAAQSLPVLHIDTTELTISDYMPAVCEFIEQLTKT
mgnify:CR=1 FL=1